MTRASGCGSKTLIRAGAGNLKSLVVLTFLGIAAYMTLKGAFAPWRVNGLDPLRFDGGIVVGAIIVGGVLMGFGGVTAGCTIGQGLTGISTLAIGSVLTLGAIVVGCVAAVRYQMWRVERMA